MICSVTGAAGLLMMMVGWRIWLKVMVWDPLEELRVKLVGPEILFLRGCGVIVLPALLKGGAVSLQGFEAETGLG